MKSKIKKVFAKILFLIVFILPVLFNVLPNIYAYFKTPLGYSYTGNASWFDPWDVNVYVSAIRFGQTGHILLENNYTTTNNPPALFYPLYTAIGYFFRSTNPYLLFHLFAVIFGLFLVFLILFVIKVFLGNPWYKTGLMLIALGGGFGWLLNSSPDITMTGFTFNSAFQRPHEAVGLSLYILALTLFYLSTKTTNTSRNKIITVCLLLQIIFYSYLVLSYFLIALIFGLYLYKKEKITYPIKNLFFQLIVVLPPLLLYVLLLQKNPGFNLVYKVILPHPSLSSLLLGYGILSPLILLQLISYKHDGKTVFLNIWFFLSFSLIFLPLGFARFYLKTLFVPLILLVLNYLPELSKKLKAPESSLTAVIIIFIPLTSLYIFYERIIQVNNKNVWTYITTEKKKSLDYLNNPQFKNKGILSLYKSGNLIPANTDLKVYFGHFLQTPDAANKIKQAVSFYTNKMKNDQAKRFLKDENLQFVYFGEEERNVILAYAKKDTLDYDFLKPIYEFGKIKIYKVN